jgi:hypothetical protein
VNRIAATGPVRSAGVLTFAQRADDRVEGAEVFHDLDQAPAIGDRRYVVPALADDRFAARSGSDGVVFRVFVRGAAPRTRVGSLAFASDHRPAVFRPPIGIALVPNCERLAAFASGSCFDRIACRDLCKRSKATAAAPTSMRSCGRRSPRSLRSCSDPTNRTTWYEGFRFGIEG